MNFDVRSHFIRFTGSNSKELVVHDEPQQPDIDELKAVAEMLLESIYFPSGAWRTSPEKTKELLIDIQLREAEYLKGFPNSDQANLHFFSRIFTQSFDQETEDLALLLLNDFRNPKNKNTSEALRALLLFGSFSLCKDDVLYQSPCLKIVALCLATKQLSNDKFQIELQNLVKSNKITSKNAEQITYAISSVCDGFGWMKTYSSRFGFKPSDELRTAYNRYLGCTEEPNATDYAFELLSRKVEDREWVIFKLYQQLCCIESSDTLRMTAGAKLSQLFSIQRDVFKAYRRDQLESLLEYGFSWYDREVQSEQIASNDFLAQGVEITFLTDALNDSQELRQGRSLDLLFAVRSLNQFAAPEIDKAVWIAVNNKSIKINHLHRMIQDKGVFKEISKWIDDLQKLTFNDNSDTDGGPHLPPLIRQQTSQFSFAKRRENQVLRAIERTLSEFALYGIYPFNHQDFTSRLVSIIKKDTSPNLIQSVFDAFNADPLCPIKKAHLGNTEDISHIERVTTYYLAKDLEEVQGLPIESRRIKKMGSERFAQEPIPSNDLFWKLIPHRFSYHADSAKPSISTDDSPLKYIGTHPEFLIDLLSMQRNKVRAHLSPKNRKVIEEMSPEEKQQTMEVLWRFISIFVRQDRSILEGVDRIKNEILLRNCVEIIESLNIRNKACSQSLLAIGQFLKGTELSTQKDLPRYVIKILGKTALPGSGDAEIRFLIQAYDDGYTDFAITALGDLGADGIKGLTTLFPRAQSGTSGELLSGEKLAIVQHLLNNGIDGVREIVKLCETSRLESSDIRFIVERCYKALKMETSKDLNLEGIKALVNY